MLRNVLLAGVEVDSGYVLWLATELIAAGHNNIAATLLNADSGGGNVALTVVMHEPLLRILDDRPSASLSFERSFFRSRWGARAMSSHECAPDVGQIRISGTTSADLSRHYSPTV